MIARFAEQAYREGSAHKGRNSVELSSNTAMAMAGTGHQALKQAIDCPPPPPWLGAIGYTTH